MFYSNGKVFCLRGVKEHRAIKISQFQCLTEPDWYVYTENGSKNRCGGFNDLKVPILKWFPFLPIHLLVQGVTSREHRSFMWDRIRNCSHEQIALIQSSPCTPRC